MFHQHHRWWLHPLTLHGHRHIPATPIARYLTGASPVAAEFVEGLLCKCPARRLSSRAAMQHAYFAEAPGPTPHSRLPFVKSISALSDGHCKGNSTTSGEKPSELDMRPSKRLKRKKDGIPGTPGTCGSPGLPGPDGVGTPGEDGDASKRPVHIVRDR